MYTHCSRYSSRETLDMKVSMEYRQTPNTSSSALNRTKKNDITVNAHIWPTRGSGLQTCTKLADVRTGLLMCLCLFMSVSLSVQTFFFLFFLCSPLHFLIPPLGFHDPSSGCHPPVWEPLVCSTTVWCYKYSEDRSLTCNDVDGQRGLP